MKIGIITVHRAYNYGSVLQCYALQEYLKSLGHDVWVVDYRQPWTEAVYKPFSLYFIRKRISHPREIFNYIKKYNSRKYLALKRKTVFSSFMNRFRLTKSCYNVDDIPQDFDVYIIGSDQLWSHTCFGGEDKVYLGFFNHKINTKIIGYALSSNTNSLNIFGKRRLSQIISNFDSLSVREDFIAGYIYENLGKDIPVVLDPTLLTNTNLWDSLINDDWKDRNYIAIYQARNVIGNPTYLKDKAQNFANRLKCEVIDLTPMTYSVEDFVSIIKYARYVLTTSFHATVFSLIMETPCYAIKLNDGFDGRYIDLLKSLGIENEIVDKDFDTIEIEEIDFVFAKQNLNKLKQASINFLKNSLVC